ncbi:MAG: response regulator [Aquificae bacterium]|nr:response regulator [Aquificota bacterium]
MKILLLDDDIETYRILQEVAQFSSSEVIQVSDINEAKMLLEHRKDIDGIVAEVRLNGQPTWEILSFMRRNENIEEIPFVILAKELTEDEEAFFKHMKATAVLRKPFNPLDVFTEIAEDLKKKKGEEYVRDKFEEQEVDKSLLKKIIEKLVTILRRIIP